MTFPPGLFYTTPVLIIEWEKNRKEKMNVEFNQHSHIFKKNYSQFGGDLISIYQYYITHSL